MTEIGIREIVCPAIEDPGQGGSLAAARGQVLLQNEHQDYVALGGEVRDVFGDDDPAFGPGGRRHLRVAECSNRPASGPTVFPPVWPLTDRELSSPTDTAGSARASAQETSVRATDLP